MLNDPNSWNGIVFNTEKYASPSDDFKDHYAILRNMSEKGIESFDVYHSEAGYLIVRIIPENKDMIFILGNGVQDDREYVYCEKHAQPLCGINNIFDSLMEEYDNDCADIDGVYYQNIERFIESFPSDINSFIHRYRTRHRVNIMFQGGEE